MMPLYPTQHHEMCICHMGHKTSISKNMSVKISQASVYSGLRAPRVGLVETAESAN